MWCFLLNYLPTASSHTQKKVAWALYESAALVIEEWEDVNPFPDYRVLGILSCG